MRQFCSKPRFRILTSVCLASAALSGVAVAQEAYPAATRGEAAVEALGGRLADLAARAGLSRAELEGELRADESLFVDGNGRLFFVDPHFVDGDGDDGSTQFRGPVIPPSEAFTLHSRPGSNYTIYLDFDGHHSVNNSWGHNIVFPAFDRNGTPGTFENSELNEIIAHWRNMAEDFAPFDVDVTTEEPTLDQLTRSGGSDTTWGVRDLHTQATGGFGDGIGGVAFLNSFDDSIDNPVFSFNKGGNNGGITGSHEVGHALGLFHDGLDGASYHPGASSGPLSWGPIMGAPFGSDAVQWSNGDYVGSTTLQDDVLTIIRPANGLTLLPDDHGDAVGSGTLIAPSCPNPSSAIGTGVIERRTDVDAFRFVSPPGQVIVDAQPAMSFANLDLGIELYDSVGSLIASDAPLQNQSAGLALSVAGGEYTLLVYGDEEPGLFSDYGSLGEYTLDVNLPVPPDHFTDLGFGLPAGPYVPTLVGSGYACEGNTVSVSLSGAPIGAQAFLAYGPDRIDAPVVGGVLVPNVAAGGGALALSTDFFGRASVSNPWPAGTPSGATLYFQFWIRHPTGPRGYLASNAVVITVP